MNDHVPGQDRTLRAEQAESGTMGAGGDEGAREARYAEAMSGIEVWVGFRDEAGDDACALGTVDFSDLRDLARKVLPLVDAEVAAAVSQARREGAAEALRQAAFDLDIPNTTRGTREDSEAATGEAEEARLEAALDAQVSLLSAPDNWQARAEAAERELRARELHHFETEQENAAMRQGLAALAELPGVREKFNDLLHDVRWLRGRMDDPNARLDFIAHDADQVLNKDGRKPCPLPSVTPTPAPVSSGGIVTPNGVTPGGMPTCPKCGRWGSNPGGLCVNNFHDAPVSSGEAGEGEAAQS